MPRPPTYRHPLREIRTQTDYNSQPRFAELVGVSAATIQAIENGKLTLSRRLAMRIRTATGADHRELMKGAKGRPITVYGKRYTKEFFDRWILRRDRGGTGGGGYAEQSKFWADVLLGAASQKRGAEARAVHFAIAEALDEIAAECDLEEELAGQLRAYQTVEQIGLTVEEWERLPEEQRERFGFPAGGGGLERDTRLSIGLQLAPAWNPGGVAPETFRGRGSAGKEDAHV